MTELYQYVEHHPPSPNWWESWHHRIAVVNAYERSGAGAAAVGGACRMWAVDGDNKHLMSWLNRCLVM